MAEVASAVNFTDEGFEAFLQSRQEPDWLTTQRRQAWQFFQQQAWPARNHEEWMRTDIRLFKLDRFGLALDSEPPQDLPQPILADGVELAGHSISVDGRTVRYQLDPRWAQRGVVFGSLADLMAEHSQLIHKHLLCRAVDPHHDRFSALHTSFWSSGNLVYVPRGVTLDQPLHLQSVLSDGAADLGHTLIVLEDGAEATVLAEMQSPTKESTGFHCGAIELILGAGSNLRFVNVQDWGHGAWHFSHQKAVVGRDAQLQWTIGALGSKVAKVNQQVELAEPGAYSQVNGVLFTEGKQHLAYHTLQHHTAPDCRSDFLYKAALQDRSRTVWRGMIKVDPDAQKTDGYQRNDNLLLSDQARADSIPGLEIEADDVRCTHGSTSGKVDEELIFYARCRGFTRQEAIRAIVNGFFQQIFDRVTIESVRNAMGDGIARRVRDYA